MSTHRERRRAKKIEKQRKKRTAAQRSRGSRAAPGGGGVAEAVAWPVGECWIGENWHERGARVAAAFTRRHDDGQVVAALFEVDLAEKGVIRAELRRGEADAAMGELARWSEDETLMLAEPERVVTLVHAALRHGQEGGHPEPRGLRAAMQLFGEVQPDDAQHEIRCGAEEPEPQAPPPQPGIWARWKQRLGIGSEPR